MSHLIYLSLGSNLGDRLANLQNAISGLPPKIQPLVRSSIYETSPWGYSDQPDFYNQVIKAETLFEPADVLETIKSLEVSLGRQETFRFGPRLIDLDLLFYDALILNSPKLTIPHPRITERAFVLVPLAEIAPDLVHPGIGKTIQQLKSSIDTSSVKLIHSFVY
jgi:2-amino-4-hydroxy-6-hydroxymethyldihydropteridine diphosphokinase